MFDLLPVQAYLAFTEGPKWLKKAYFPIYVKLWYLFIFVFIYVIILK